MVVRNNATIDSSSISVFATRGEKCSVLLLRRHDAAGIYYAQLVTVCLTGNSKTTFLGHLPDFLYSYYHYNRITI